MHRLSIAVGAFVVWAILSSAPIAGLAQNAGTAGGCATSITACNGPGAGTVGQTVVSSNNGCTVIDDGNIDDPPAPGILVFDDDADDGQIISQCPQLAPPPVTPPAVTAASCTQAPPSTWYNPADPVHGVPSVAGPAWTTKAQAMGSALFNALFVFEIFMLGLHALLHRNDITHLFSSFAFKTFVATFFIYLTWNAPTVFPKVFSSFQVAGQSIGASNYNNIYTMYDKTDQAAALFFCAAMASHIEDQRTALEYGTFGLPGPLGSGDMGHTLQGAVGHITFEFIVQGLGMLVIAAAGIMFLSLALVTAESYITMFAGAFFLGFSSTRFTLPFTQGYLSYAVNVGVKMLTFWVLIAVETNILLPILLTAGTKLIGAASIQFGAQTGLSAEMYLVSAAVDVAQILALAALTWFLPNILGRFVSGRSGSSAAQIVYTLASSLKGGSLATAGPASAGLPGPISPAQLLRGPIRVTPSRESFTTTVAPQRGPLAGFGEAIAASIASPLSPTGAAAVAASGVDNIMNTDASKQPVQASVADGPDPFAITPKVSPIIINLQPQLGKHAERPLAGAPTKTLAEVFPADGAMRPNATPMQSVVVPFKSSGTETGSFSSPGFHVESIRPKTQASAPQNADIKASSVSAPPSNAKTTESAGTPTEKASAQSQALNAAQIRQTIAQNVADTQTIRQATPQSVDASKTPSGTQSAAVRSAALPANAQAPKNRSDASGVERIGSVLTTTSYDRLTTQKYSAASNGEADGAVKNGASSAEHSATFFVAESTAQDEFQAKSNMTSNDVTQNGNAQNASASPTSQKALSSADGKPKGGTNPVMFVKPLFTKRNNDEKENDEPLTPKETSINDREQGAADEESASTDVIVGEAT